jgi:hypothetical protein
MPLTWIAAHRTDGCLLRKLMILTGLATLVAPPPVVAQSVGQPAPTGATGSVNLNPKRITFDRPGRSAAVGVSSVGAGAFDVETIDRVMLPDGQIVTLAEAHRQGRPEAARLKSAKAYIVATPRRIRASSAGQTIRLRATPSAELSAGEYRTHLTVQGIPPADTGFTADAAASGRPDQLSFRISSVLAISIPVILRVGPIDVRAGIEKPALSFENISPDGTKAPVRTAVLRFDLVRVGANSLFGDVDVRGSKRGEEPIGAVRGVGVYPEIDRRQMRIPLARIPAPGEIVQIEFRDDDTSPGKILSKTSVTAP